MTHVVHGLHPLRGTVQGLTQYLNLRTWYTDCIGKIVMTIFTMSGLICARGTRIASANMHKFFYIFTEGFI